MFRRTRSWLRPILQPNRQLFREVLAMSLFVNLLALSVPLFVLQVYDRVVFHAGLGTLQALVLGMGIVLLFDFVLRQARGRLLQKMALRIDVEVGRKLFDKLAALPLRALESRPTSYWQTLFRDVETVRNTLSGASTLLLADLPFIVLFLGLIFVIATPVIWVLFVMLGLFVFVAWRSAASVGGATIEEKRFSLGRDALIGEMMAGRTTIKALALDDSLRPTWEARHASTIEASMTRGQRADSYVNLGSTLGMLTTIALTTVGAVAILNQEMTIGALVAANILAGRFVSPLLQLVSTWRTYAGFRDAAQRLGEVFELAEDRTVVSLGRPRPNGSLALEEASFAYGDASTPIVAKLSMRLGPGGVHAIVGENGSGKTTLLKLMQGLYAPTRGRVLLDGSDIAQFTRAQLARWIGYVPEECFLFAGTIRDNITIGEPDADDARILDAAERAGVHKFAVDLPDGYDTEIGEGGALLSRGQRQRVAIARALLRDPPVLLLDEPSGNLDRQAEAALREQITGLARDHTIVMVTHSPVLLSACDSVMALQDGKIRLAGRSDEVLPKLFGDVFRPRVAE